MQTDRDPNKQYTIDLFTDEQGLDQVYTEHYVPLYHYAYTMLSDAECLNHFKHEKVKLAHVGASSKQLQYHSDTPSGKMQYKELELRVQEAINSLPEQCRTIFQLSRFEELKYADIALQLDLSIKTVENQMSKALKRLRLQLADKLPAC